MWEQIVTNLVANAIKYTNSGSIEVRLRAEGTDVRLEVADTGVGIPEEDLPFVFDQFRRARTPRARTQEGTGLGLAIVRELVNLHGGTVEVESTPGDRQPLHRQDPDDSEPTRWVRHLQRG